MTKDEKISEALGKIEALMRNDRNYLKDVLITLENGNYNFLSELLIKAGVFIQELSNYAKDVWNGIKEVFREIMDELQ